MTRLGRPRAATTRVEALNTIRHASEAGLNAASICWLAPPAADPDAAAAAQQHYQELLEALGAATWTGEVGDAGDGAMDVLVSVTALGVGLAGGESIALGNVRAICATARNTGVSVTLTRGGDPYTAELLALAAEVWEDYPDVGVTLQAARRRTDTDCRTHAGRRVRLVSGHRRAIGRAAVGGRHQVDRQYVRCLRTLVAGGGHVVAATHDQRLWRIALALAEREGRLAGEVSLQVSVDGLERARRVLGAAAPLSVLVPYRGPGTADRRVQR